MRAGPKAPFMIRLCLVTLVTLENRAICMHPAPKVARFNTSRNDRLPGSDVPGIRQKFEGVSGLMNRKPSAWSFFSDQNVDIFCLTWVG
jgi:hypothetical protein